MNDVTNQRATTRAKQPVNLTLSTGLVRRAKALTPNLSDTVETLLKCWVTEAEGQLITQWVEETNAHIAAHGIPGEEYGTVG